MLQVRRERAASQVSRAGRDRPETGVRRGQWAWSGCPDRRATVDRRELLAARDLTDRAASQDRSDKWAIVVATDCPELQVICVTQSRGCRRRWWPWLSAASVCRVESSLQDVCSRRRTRCTVATLHPQLQPALSSAAATDEWVLSWHLNEPSDSSGDRRAVGSRFQVLESYAAELRWPVDVRVQGTRRAPETAERDWRRPSVDATGTQRSVGQVTWRCVVQTLPRQHRRLKDHFFVGTFQSPELTDTEVTSLVVHVDDIHRVTDGQSLQVVDFGFVKIIQQLRNDCDRSSCYCEYDTQLTHAQLPTRPICSHTTHLTIEFYFIRSSCCYNIYIISISILSPPLFHSRLKTLLFCKSFTP